MSKFRYRETRSNDKDFITLVKELDAYLSIVDGNDHAFYDQYNGLDESMKVIVLYEENLPIACGAFKPFDDNRAEVKRMFVLPAHRRKGAAQVVLQQLERLAKTHGYSETILETGKKQTEAIAFYHTANYEVVPNFGPYVGVENSVCFAKQL